MPALATSLNSGCITDCNQISYDSGRIAVRRSTYSGKAISTLTFDSPPPYFITIRPNQFRGEVQVASSPEVKQESVELSESTARLKLTERKVEEVAGI